jgi:hypothetical protein
VCRDGRRRALVAAASRLMGASCRSKQAHIRRSCAEQFIPRRLRARSPLAARRLARGRIAAVRGSCPLCMPSAGRAVHAIGSPELQPIGACRARPRTLPPGRNAIDRMSRLRRATIQLHAFAAVLALAVVFASAAGRPAAAAELPATVPAIVAVAPAPVLAVPCGTPCGCRCPDCNWRSRFRRSRHDRFGYEWYPYPHRWWGWQHWGYLHDSCN